jgi:hypothetical protein
MDVHLIGPTGEPMQGMCGNDNAQWCPITEEIS